jgi:superfamily II DNA or RNA helicase
MPPFYKTEVHWGNADLVIKHPPPGLLETLYYTHKSLEPDPKRPYSRRSVKERVDLWRPIDADTYTTFQGFMDRVVAWLQASQTPFDFFDHRIKLEPPRLRAATGFRHSQHEVFFRTLAATRSGLCKAPTRYGKTAIMANMLRVFPNTCAVVTAPGVNLLAQLQDDLKKWLPTREIKGIYTGSRNKKPSEDITLISMDSLDKADTEQTRLLLIDEPHAAVAPSRIPSLLAFRHARIIGFGATLTGRFDGADSILEGLIGPVLAERTYAEAVAEGAICPITVFMLKVPFVPWPCFNRDSAYRELIYRSNAFNSLVQRVSTEVIPTDWQSIIFIDEIKQADLMQKLVDDGVIAVASRMNRAQREEMYQRMVTAEIKRCMATDIYATGLTFPDLRVMINAAGGGGAITSTQKPGRLAQVRPGKKAGYVIDFLFEPKQIPDMPVRDDWRSVVIDCNARLNNYKKAGFDVRVIADVSEIKLV